MKKLLFLFASIFIGMSSLFAQDDLLDEINSEDTADQFEMPAFKATRIINGQSTKLASKKEFHMIISHRFGSINDGISTFFGLDNANTYIGLLYGITDRINVAIGRETYRKTVNASLKVKLLEQHENMPIHLVAFGGFYANTQLSDQVYTELTTIDRFSYLFQLQMSRRFTDHLSLQLSPKYVRQNLKYSDYDVYNYFVVGIGGRYKVSKRVALTAEYDHNFSRSSQNPYLNPLSLGVDLETGGHVFQLLFSNAQANLPPSYLTYATGDWSKGEIYFGFNIVRVF
ncbi:DUF5777 family beta-barrel protein [Flammeovirga pacifica]|uniref:DUF5777 domain-containing protein n=1 Tax=Flammeovirga pacifica TaxID=915059 RepID=A0A1S1YV55_FLAPC|nr:DUF5777 family beta-barrel protein [Flammeovirga pacifica]OHX64899.1 hypothetical protein NH26_00340 [Flammeovirga pacifica]